MSSAHIISAFNVFCHILAFADARLVQYHGDIAVVEELIGPLSSVVSQHWRPLERDADLAPLLMILLSMHIVSL